MHSVAGGNMPPRRLHKSHVRAFQRAGRGREYWSAADRPVADGRADLRRYHPQPDLRPRRRAGRHVAVRADTLAGKGLCRGHARHATVAANSSTSTTCCPRSASGSMLHRGVLALTLNYSAYISEVYRGGIQAMPRGQHDAAAALGMTHAFVDAPHHPAAGDPHYHPHARQLLHRPVQGHRTCSAVSLQNWCLPPKSRRH